MTPRLVAPVLCLGLLACSQPAPEAGETETMMTDPSGSASSDSPDANRPTDDPRAGARPVGGGEIAQVRPVEGQSGPYSWASGETYFGYYRPAEPVRLGDWELNHVFIGGPMEFDHFEAGGRAKPAVPVWIEFWPVDGERAVNELGGEYAVDARRVRPDSFALEPGRFEFRAGDSELGTVILSGALHLDALEADADTPGFTGGVEAAGDHVRNLSLMHYQGD